MNDVVTNDVITQLAEKAYEMAMTRGLLYGLALGAAVVIAVQVVFKPFDSSNKQEALPSQSDPLISYPSYSR